jgi:hypothetical protein
MAIKTKIRIKIGMIFMIISLKNDKLLKNISDLKIRNNPYIIVMDIKKYQDPEIFLNLFVEFIKLHLK